jgi:hypothetical protein
MPVELINYLGLLLPPPGNREAALQGRRAKSTSRSPRITVMAVPYLPTYQYMSIDPHLQISELNADIVNDVIEK